MRSSSVVLIALLTFSNIAAAQEKLSPKAQQIVTSLEPLLPEYEEAAAGYEKALEPFRQTADPKQAAAIDSTLLQIEAIRSVRKIIAQQPEYLTWHIGPMSLQRWKDGAEHFLAALREGKDPFAGMTEGTRPFRSKIDGQLLLYQFTLPADYDPAKKYPLRIELHSGAGFTWLAYWVKGKPDASPRSAAQDGAIHISPAGRQHVGLGEIAILEAIADAKRHYSVDEDRVTIGGASYGGTGGFHFGTLLPDHFAAAHSLTGGGNYAVPVGNGRFDAYLLGDNLANLPFLIWDTPGDGHYRANHAFADGLGERAAKHPGHYPHLELTDPKGGHGVIDRALLAAGRKWLGEQVRNRYPKLVVYETHCLRYDGAYWARIDTVVDPAQPARIEAQIHGETCRIKIDNADRFHLDLAPELVGSAKEIAVSINGSGPLSAPGGQVVNFRQHGGKWTTSSERYPAGLVKKHGISGPIQDVFMEHPVLLVYGDRAGRSQADTTKSLDEIVNRMIGRGDGSGVLRTGFERKSAAAVSEADIADKNLILVGTPEQNSLVAKIADRLPIQFLAGGVQIGGQEHRGERLGLVMIYPNPLNPERYVLLVPEQYWGEKPWAYPDYVLFQSPPAGQTRGRIVAQGTFDSRWQLVK
jgi:hypothetical protein